MRNPGSRTSSNVPLDSHQTKYATGIRGYDLLRLAKSPYLASALCSKPTEKTIPPNACSIPMEFRKQGLYTSDTRSHVMKSISSGRTLSFTYLMASTTLS